MNTKFLPILCLLAATLPPCCVAADEALVRERKGRALLAEIAARLREDTAAEAGTAHCELSAAEIKPHRAHGRRELDFTRSVTLRNRHTAYAFRYWVTMDSPDASTCEAIEGSTGLGMEQPSRHNWYANNFLELDLGGKPILKTAWGRFEVESESGPEAGFRVCWDTPEAEVVLRIRLRADAENLTVSCNVSQKGPGAQKTRIGFRAYPGHYPPPRARCAATPLRELIAPQCVQLEPTETSLILYDALDLNTSCGIRFSDPGTVSPTLDLGEYGVTLWLHLAATPRADTGEILLWDLPRLSLNAAMERILGSPAQ